MTGHDPRAADVIAHGFDPDEPEWDYIGNIDREDEWYTTPRELATTALDALAAAGLVVRPAADEYVPPQHMTDPTLTAVLYGDDDSLEWTGAPQLAWGPVAVPLYVRKENPND